MTELDRFHFMVMWNIGASIDEIGYALGIPAGAVNATAKRIMERMND